MQDGWDEKQGIWTRWAQEIDQNRTIGRSNQIKVQSVNDALPNLTNLSSWGPAEN